MQERLTADAEEYARQLASSTASRCLFVLDAADLVDGGGDAVAEGGLMGLGGLASFLGVCMLLCFLGMMVCSGQGLGLGWG